MGVSLYSLCVPSDFGGRTGSDVNMSHALLQGVLMAITLVESDAGSGGTRARGSCEPGLLLCSVANTTHHLMGAGLGSKLLEQKS